MGLVGRWGVEERRAVGWFRQVVEAVGYCHSKNVCIFFFFF